MSAAGKPNANIRETILAALHARLQTLAATVLRGDVLPERIPTEGLIILRDGKPGDPEVTLSPLSYYYAHRAEIEVVIQAGERAGRLAERLATSEKANAIQRHMPDAAARRPRDRDDLAQRMRDGRF